MEAGTALKNKTAAPTFQQLMRAVEDLVPLAEAGADEAERISHQTDKLIAEFRRTGLYLILLPKALGGLELPYAEAMKLVERMAWAEGSSGWCFMVQGVVSASMGAFLPDKGAREVFGKTADVTAAGNGVPRGFARPVDGGYMIKGNWSYGSGIYHAEWIHSGCFIMDGDKMRLNKDGAPEIVLSHHPKDSIVLKGNWDVLGLRATGSFDYTLKEPELFVPTHMCYMFDDHTPARGGLQYSPGLVSLTTWGHTSWALGVARRALDELAKHARGRAPDVFGKLTDSATFKKAFADAEAKYRAARALVYESWQSLDDSFAAGKHASLEQLTLIRLAMRHLHDVMSEVTTFAHRTSRGASLRSSALQRCYRDAHAGTQHVLLGDEIVQECGRVLVGATGPNAEWNLFGVKG